MTWKKKLLLPLLVVLFSLSLSVFGCEKSVNATNRRVTGVKFGLVNSSANGDTANVTATTINAWGAFKLDYSFSTGNADGTSIYYVFSDPTLTLNNTLSFGPDTYLQLDYYVVFTSVIENSNIGVYCPSNAVPAGAYPVYDCKIEPVTRQTYFTRGTIDTNGQDGIIDYNTRTAQFYHLTYKLDNTSNVTTRTVPISGPIFKVYVPGTSQTTRTFNLFFDFDYAKTFTKEKSADEKMNDKDDQDRADLENQSSETDSDANSAGADASNSGTTLLGVFSSFVSALATIHETNCNLPNMSVYGLQLNNINLCTFNVPPGLVALATVGMVFIIVPLSFNLARRLVNIFRSFQG